MGEAAPALREAALRLLGRREHSQRELAQKLRKRFPEVPGEQVEAELKALAEAGYQSDARRQASLIRQAELRGQGPGRLDAKLPPENPEDPTALEARLAALQQQRFGGAPADAKAWQKQARFFAYRGFPPGLIRRCLGEIPWGDSEA
jgi:regulatory protein